MKSASMGHKRDHHPETTPARVGCQRLGEEPGRLAVLVAQLPSALIPQATASVAATTAWVGPTGAVLADRKTPSGRCANDGTCSNCSAPTLYRMCGPPPSESQQHPPTCPACPSRLSSARASPAAARPDGLLLADEPEPGTSPAVKTGRIATAGTPVRT